METCHGRVLFLATGILMSAFLPAEGAPLPSYRTGGADEPAAASLHLSLVLSLTALAALVALLVNCVTCCKERPINFKEFEDNFDDEIDFTPPAEDTPSMQSPAEVYTLAVPPVALPGPPHLQPPSRIAEGSAGVQVDRHTLSYIQEIGNGWFGKVLLSEIYSDPAAARVVVKELKANASAKEQNDFLQHGDPYRVLQHPNLLQCLGQCVEAIPFLLVFEYCEMGDLRSYLSQQDWMFRNAELLQLQKMACEIAAGVTHLHKHNFLHSDLALRNCFLTADLTVKVGDYGIGPYRYKEDYIITEDDVSAPLRWLAPELVGERHGGVITMEQTKPGNVWALGVTLWELLENAGQPYPHLSDREVLNHVIREQQVKPFKPQLELPYSERWYEVLQFCWLAPDKRATAEEVHRLLTYLRMQGQKDMEEDFEQRWSALKPNPTARQTTVSDASFPILEQFAEDSLRPEVDEVLTVTETSRGLSFEYVWEAAKHDHYDGSHGRSAMDTTLNYHSMFFPVPSDEIQAHFPDPAARAGSTETGSAPSGVPGILPVLDAHEPSSGKEYYIQLEEQGESACEENENRGSDADTLSDRQEFVVLQDVHLDESSTDADFFHQSIDSKDSLLQDSHIWSSSEHESPYHTNIFSEGEPKQENSHSWEKSFMELPVRNGNPFLQGASLEAQEAGTDKSFGDSFLGDRLETAHRGESSGREESPDVSRLLNTEKLADNFLFLTENSLIKESSGSSSGNRSPQQDLLSPGLPHSPEDSFKMSSWDNLDNLDGAGIAETPLKPAERNTFPKEGLSDLNTNFLQPARQEETLVPSITLVPEQTFDIKMTVGNGSSSEDFDLLNSSDTGIDSAFDSSSGGIDVLTSVADSYPSLTLFGSATADPLCIDAKPPRFEDFHGSSKNSFQPIEVNKLADEQAHLSPPINSHSEGLTSDDLLSELIEEDETEAVLSDHDGPTVEEEEEEEEEEENNDTLQVNSTLLVSGTSMDQISQDSLLDDSVSTTPPTADNLAETPDSLDSLDIHRLDGQAEELHAPAAPQKLQPPYKTADSGYETENLESPEWISQPIVKDHSLEENGTSVAEDGEEDEIPGEPAVATTLVPPEIVVSEVESVDAEDEETSEDQPPEPLVPGDEPFIGGNYRDSAYFSDNESEPERKFEETNGASAAEAPGPMSSTANQISSASGTRPAKSQSAAGEEPDSSLVFQQERLKSNATSSDDNVGQSEPLPQPGNGFSELALSGEEDWDKEVATSTDDGHKDTTRLELFPDVSPSTEPAASQPSLPLPTSAKPLPENMVHAKLTRTYASDSPKLKESNMEGRYLGRQDGSGTDVPEDGMEADEEDENSDDSDDDTRAYRLHSSSSESEDDTVHPVPVIISDDSSSRNLRSLLKAAAPNVQPELSPSAAALSPADNARRAVSFFDDVTVYLFDQETPTKELGDHSSGSNSQVAEFSSPVPTPSYLNRFTNSESSTDEEGGGFEWDDDFSSPDASFLTKGSNDSAVSKALSTPAASNYFSPPLSTGRASDTSWTSASSNYSRFSISPASIANFSLTHLTDSDIEQGGDSEDGEKD
ncbi:serine/threonine-protein kinase LMTK2 [Aplochiton taeniatus]